MRMYQDRENRAYSHILTTLFPEQTKSLPRILIWSVIFLIDLILVVGGAFYLGLLPSTSKLTGILLLVVVIGLFWVEGFLWSTFLRLFRS